MPALTYVHTCLVPYGQKRTGVRAGGSCCVEDLAPKLDPLQEVLPHLPPSNPLGQLSSPSLPYFIKLRVNLKLSQNKKRFSFKIYETEIKRMKRNFLNIQ